VGEKITFYSCPKCSHLITGRIYNDPKYKNRACTNCRCFNIGEFEYSTAANSAPMRIEMEGRETEKISRTNVLKEYELKEYKLKEYKLKEYKK